MDRGLGMRCEHQYLIAATVRVTACALIPRCASQVWSGVRHSDGHGGFDAEINTTDAAVIVVGPNSYDPNGAIGADVEAHPGKPGTLKLHLGCAFLFAWHCFGSKELP
jgi:hypothetical protein